MLEQSVVEQTKAESYDANLEFVEKEIKHLQNEIELFNQQETKLTLDGGALGSALDLEIQKEERENLMLKRQLDGMRGSLAKKQAVNK